MSNGWQFWIDRGGTFTDIVALTPGGAIRTAKLLSHDPDRYADAAVAGIERLLVADGDTLDNVDTVKMGTTVATNALLEHRGEPTLLAITRGFGDALRIGYQARPDLFARHIVLPEQAYAAVIEIDERVTAEGETLVPLDEQAARAALAGAFDSGLRAVAIVLMHGYRHQAHERRLAEIACEIGFPQISVSHEAAALVKLIGRGETTVVDAYLSPVLRRYVDQVTRGLGTQTRLLFMQSNGGLADAGAFRGKDAILSGPAGGIVGMAATANAAGLDRLIGFDMGGTSTDVSHHAGSFERTGEAIVAGLRVRAPMLQIHTVAAGGGSICRFDGARLRVGPESAGADPGPACYRRGGPLTITDCNLLLGRIRGDRFPALFGPNGDLPIDRDIVEQRFAALADEVEAATGLRRTAEELADGFLTIAVAAMANAIKTISVARGHDVTRYTLVSFGGAGGQHACAVADALAMDRIMIHPLAGVLSAFGMGLARQRVVREATVALPADDPAIDAALGRLAQEAARALADQGSSVDATERRLRLRYAGADSTLTLAAEPCGTLAARFTDLHRARFGFAAEGTSIIADAAEAEAIGPTLAAGARFAPAANTPAVPNAGGAMPLFDRDALPAGQAIDGPALIVDGSGTTFIAPGWRATVDTTANLIIERMAPREARRAAGTDVDPVLLELFNNLFMAIAEQMGVALQQTAYSVNIKERLDFSCALFDAAGNLVANAPHMPVHLGSMGESIRAVMANRLGGADGRGMRRGDVYALNDPYHGGTHLPDVTVIMPVFADPTDAAPRFYVAARGHQADIGGTTPGSMPSDSRSIAEEGVLLDDVLLVDEGRFLEAELRALLAGGRWPARGPDQNIGDIRAQIAACARGAEELRRTCAEHGLETVCAYMGHVQANAAETVRALLARIDGGRFAYAMDNGAEVAVTIDVDRAARTARVDFTGTSAQRDDNFNAPRSIVRAALLYVVRTLVDEPIPMNDGCLEPFEIVVPEGSMLNPRYPAAVVAGNVETSQVVTDALFGAFGAMAAAQGTMNNFTFGDETRQYYETICGGSGAGRDHPGTAAVQTHMTNSRLTDPEILETRFPVLVESFAIRPGSGGRGAQPGGDGAIRRIRFRAAMTAAILSNRRAVPPFGLAGGGNGAPGRNRVERRDGRIEDLPAAATVAMEAGDLFEIATPGGGGYGKGEA
ncbi:hydantoinase B/oxoprolinase family protein [Sphingomonas sp. 1P06PA]|uniref:hydantoinase B/oxoprolinase family protein n=1 Tax=Sphingomonas sp. 1P06PA TaxID=554121 RepID=UPI0039A646FA